MIRSIPCHCIRSSIVKVSLAFFSSPFIQVNIKLIHSIYGILQFLRTIMIPNSFGTCAHTHTRRQTDTASVGLWLWHTKWHAWNIWKYSEIIQANPISLSKNFLLRLIFGICFIFKRCILVILISVFGLRLQVIHTRDHHRHHSCVRVYLYFSFSSFRC